MILYLEWEIRDESVQRAERYCSHCKRKVIFTDSGLKRRNANGKDIYEFAIFKCPEDHTWNQLIKTYHAKNYIDQLVPLQEDENCLPFVPLINMKQIQSQDVKEIHIHLRKINGHWRLDKLLALHIEDLSRNQIEKQIKDARILVDDKVVPTKMMVHSGQAIRIFL